VSTDALHVSTDRSPGSDGSLVVRLEGGSRPGTFRVQSSDLRLEPTGEALVAATLLAAMSQGRDIVIHAPVSGRLLEAVPALTRTYREWEPSRKEVAVFAPAAALRGEGPTRVGLFFSAGVDSYYSFLKHLGEITDLILIEGFEIPHSDHQLYANAARLARRIGAHYGLPVHEVATDLRLFMLQNGVEMGRAGYGTMLACIAHMLASEFGRIYVAVAHSDRDPFQDSTRTSLGQLWSTESFQLVHDGGEATRIDKLRRIAQDDFALSTLRTCVDQPTRNINCGRCEKCVRTMIGLLVIDALDRCPTFETGLDPRRIMELSLMAEGKRSFAEENLLELERTGKNPEIAAALRVAMDRAQRRKQRQRRLHWFAPLLRKVLSRAQRLFRRRA